MPEIITISGLEDGVGQDPHVSDFSSLISVTVFIGSLFILARIPRLIMALRGSGDLGDFGIIKKCRRKDMTGSRSASGQKWCLWDSKGKRVLGRHRSKSRALRQERAIQFRKHRG